MGSRFTRTREDFDCERCGRHVPGDGYTNHCPGCLWSRHVDVHPGDRAAGCRALMEPVGAVTEAGAIVIVQQCTGCGHRHRNRAAPDDSREALLALLSRPLPDPAPGRRRRPR